MLGFVQVFFFSSVNVSSIIEVIVFERKFNFL